MSDIIFRKRLESFYFSRLPEIVVMRGSLQENMFILESCRELLLKLQACRLQNKKSLWQNV